MLEIKDTRHLRILQYGKSWEFVTTLVEMCIRTGVSFLSEHAAPLGPYHRNMPRVLGVEPFLVGEIPLYEFSQEDWSVWHSRYVGLNPWGTLFIRRKGYGCTWPIRNSAPLGPYSSPMPGAIW